MTTAKRSRQATRRRLLEAARLRFREQGFEATTVRQIAADADVDAALVIRYFGSKEALFAELTLTDVDFQQLLEGDRSTLGERLATLLLSKDDGSDIEIVLRSLGTAGVADRTEDELHRRLVEPLARCIGGRDAQARAGLIISILNGLTLSVSVLKQRSLTTVRRSMLIRRIGGTLQALIDQ
jgi:AcrR family transcriptional regulator